MLTLSPADEAMVEAELFRLGAELALPRSTDTGGDSER
jgi:hypothetical protein